MKEYNLKQSVVIILVGFALLWTCLYCFVFPLLVGDGPAKVPRARSDERQLLLSMEIYREKFGSYPVGDNASIVRMLAGDNSEKLAFLYLGVHSTNTAGQYVDPWQTPYQIMFDTNGDPVILSAGVNRVFGDKDDIIVNRISNESAEP